LAWSALAIGIRDRVGTSGEHCVVLRTAMVGLAGAAGAITRYGVSRAVGVRSFPWATLSINVVGSFLLGVLLAGPGSTRWSTTVTTAAGVGFLGAFTTFSTFTYETDEMLRENRPWVAVAYVASSLVLGLVAGAIGYVVGREVA
jgi:CrcB protein